MYYLLNKDYRIRGWSDQPYVLCCRDGSTRILTEEEYRALSFCNGFLDAECILVSPACRNMMECFRQEGIVSVSEQQGELQEEQKYQKYPNRFVKAVQWSLTGRCNYKCRHCLVSAPHARLGELSIAECKTLVEQLGECGIPAVSLTGGEALLRKDFWQIVDLLLSKGIVISSLYTNGRLLTRDVLDAFCDRGIRPEISISFDGTGWHDWLRGVEGAERDALEAFALCRDRGFITVSEMCIHSRNKETLRDTVHLLVGLGVKSIKVGPIIESGEWKGKSADALSPEELFDIFLNYIPQYIEDGLPVKVNLGGIFASDGKGNWYMPVERQIEGTNPECGWLCGHARSHVYIGADGTVLPCMPMSGGHLQERFANLLKTSLREILESSFYREAVDMQIKDFLAHRPECRDCQHRFRCGGGCRGRAAGESGDYFLPDQEVCWFFKNDYPQRVRDAVGGKLEFLC